MNGDNWNAVGFDLGFGSILVFLLISWASLLHPSSFHQGLLGFGGCAACRWCLWSSWSAGAPCFDLICTKFEDVRVFFLRNRSVVYDFSS